MPNVVHGIALVLLAWALVATILWGIGYLLSRALGRLLELGRASDRVWLGLAALIAALQLWHFFLPVDWWASLVFSGVGAMGVGLALVRRCRAPALEIPPLVASILVGVPICILVANSALDAPVNFDSGMYHFQAIRWNNEYPIVPGLGNLNIQLAVEQSFLLFVAWLNVFPFFNQGFHIANSFLLAAALIPLVYLVVGLLWRPRRPTLDELVGLLMIPVLMRQVDSFDLHSPAPDFAVLVLGFVLFQRFVALVTGPPKDPRHREGSLFVLAALGGLLITVKLSGAVLALSALGGAWLISRRRRSTSEPPSGARAARVAAACALLLPVLLWMGRGLTLSGYPVFPLTVGALPVEWRVPVEATEYKAFYIRNHPRVLDAPGRWGTVLQRGWDIAIKGQGESAARQIAFLEEAMADWSWVRPWSARVWRDPAVRWPVWFLLSGALAGLVSWLARVVRSRAGQAAYRDLALLLPPGAAVVFWFWSAPEPRFGSPFLWLVALVLWALALSRLPKLVHSSLEVTGLSGAIVLACLASFVLHPVPWIRSVEANGFRPVPRAVTKDVTSRAGVEIRVPTRDRRCWDASLPSSPYVDPALEFLDPQKGLAGGFKVRR